MAIPCASTRLGSWCMVGAVTRCRNFFLLAQLFEPFLVLLKVRKLLLPSWLSQWFCESYPMHQNILHLLQGNSFGAIEPRVMPSELGLRKLLSAKLNNWFVEICHYISRILTRNFRSCVSVIRIKLVFSNFWDVDSFLSMIQFIMEAGRSAVPEKSNQLIVHRKLSKSSSRTLSALDIIKVWAHQSRCVFFVAGDFSVSIIGQTISATWTGRPESGQRCNDTAFMFMVSTCKCQGGRCAVCLCTHCSRFHETPINGVNATTTHGDPKPFGAQFWHLRWIDFRIFA